MGDRIALAWQMRGLVRLLKLCGRSFFAVVWLWGDRVAWAWRKRGALALLEFRRGQRLGCEGKYYMVKV